MDKEFREKAEFISDMILRTVAAILIIVFIVVVVSCLFMESAKADEQYPITYRVTSSTLNVRYNGGTEYESFYTLTAGEEVQGKEKDGAWTEVNCYGYKGYVWSDYITDKSQSTGGNYIGRYYVTGYNPWCSHCCGGKGLTTSGRQAVVGRTVAMAGMPFGTRLYIEGLGSYVVEDRGVGPGVIDVACSSDSACYAITGYYEVYKQ